MTDAEANDDFRGSQLFHWFAESIKTRLQVAGNVEHSSRWFVDASAAYPGRLDPQHALMCPTRAACSLTARGRLPAAVALIQPRTHAVSRARLASGPPLPTSLSRGDVTSFSEKTYPKEVTFSLYSHHVVWDVY